MERVASTFIFRLAVLTVANLSTTVFADDLYPQRLQATIANVQPMTGIVLWTTNEDAATTPIQLEYACMKYSQIVQAGFGLRAAYHIYDGPMKLGRTFPDKAFQLQFAKHHGATFRETPLKRL